VSLGARVLLAGGVVLWAGCSASHYRKSADTEAYKLIAEKTPLVTNMDPQFTIEQTNRLSLDGLPRREEGGEFLGTFAEKERGAAVLSLEKALELAVHFSRLYQNNKEQLYLSALSLSGARHEFAPLFSASGSAGYAVDTRTVTTYVPDPNDPTQLKPVLSDDLVEQHRLSASGNVGVDWLIRDVGRISADFIADFTRILSGGIGQTASSSLGARFTRPLLRNAGYKAEKEALTQAERDLLYEVREFTRYRKDFSVQIATAYYGVLGDRDAARNSHLNLQSSRRTAEQTRALAGQGRRTQSDLGRLEQQVLSAESAWINAVRTYARSLDDFKIQLGLPVETRLVLDDRDLEQLQIQHPNLNVEDCIKIALAARLDFQNTHDQYEDAVRQTRLAADRLKSQVDLAAGATMDSEEVSQGFALPDPNRYRWNVGLNFDLPLNRKLQRNAYRSAVIREEQAARSLALRRDEIELEVRESHRTLEAARRTFEISELGAKLSERRVQEQELLAQFGRARAQDQVDAQNDLVNARNQRTQALVAHTIARLQFWNNMGILYIKDKGQWQEVDDAKLK
jgi:outer membrane protein TolC